jgi:thiopurine S-methyltransferase
MQPEFWHERWRRGEIGWHQDAINLHLQEHWPPPETPRDARVFVPLCGKTRDLLWLAGEGHRVLGVEISPIAVEAFFSENGLTPAVTDEPLFRRYGVDEIEILCGDFFDLVPEQLAGVDAVFDRASLIALPPETRPRYARHLQGLLAPHTRILLVTLEYEQSEMDGPPFSVTESEVAALLGGRFAITKVDELDVWAENPRFQQRGLTRLVEQVFGLRPRAQ